jgi:hypothetical protein
VKPDSYLATVRPTDAEKAKKDWKHMAERLGLTDEELSRAKVLTKDFTDYEGWMLRARPG